MKPAKQTLQSIHSPNKIDNCLVYMYLRYDTKNFASIIDPKWALSDDIINTLIAIIPHLFIFFYVHFVRIRNIEYSYPITQSKWKIHLTENGELLQGIEHPIYSVVQNVYVLPAWLASLCLTFWFGHRQDNKCYIILKGLKNFTLFFFQFQLLSIPPFFHGTSIFSFVNRYKCVKILFCV